LQFDEHGDMTLSVIIPTFNRADYLGSSIDSVLAQDLSEIEVIVVDDGSTDDTASVIEPYLSRIRYIRTSNNGPAIARNIGMRAATGKYVSYLDDDDLYYPFKSRIQCAVLDAHPEIGMVYSDFSAFDDNGYFDERHLREYHKSAYLRGGLTYDSIFDEILPLSNYADAMTPADAKRLDRDNRNVYFGNNFDRYLMNTIVFTNSMVFRREVLEVVGEQETKFHMFHDLEFALRICKQFRVAFIDIPTYKLRYHPDQISTTDRKDGELVAIGIQRDLMRVTRCHGLWDQAYFEKNKIAVNRQLARLARATAIPMMAVETDSRHKNKYYPKRARKYLRYSAQLGYPERFLTLMTYLPSLFRRIGFRLLSLRSRYEK
jgi:glycosyltransferase involved in cell wall biosynthesis